jgi:Family of unknown function (DUF5706)
MQTQNHQSSTGDELAPADIPSAPLAVNPTSSANTGEIKADSLSTADQLKEFELRLKFGEEIHQSIRHSVRLADQKAAIFFAGATALLTYINSLGLTNKWITNPSSWGLIHVLSLTATLGLVIGCVFCAFTIMPRFDGSKKGIIFFNSIGKYSNAAEYSKDVLSREISQLCDEEYRHTYELSRVCRAKYNSLIYGFWFGIVGVFSAFLLLAYK